jgi:uncharacterized repeat protein (TIGR01451 family)
VENTTPVSAGLDMGKRYNCYFSLLVSLGPMNITVQRLSRFKSLAAALLLGMIASTSHAQSSACSANEDVVTFDFAAANATTATGSSRTWVAGATNDTFGVATAGTLRSNTITFALTLSGAVWVAGFPAQGIQGNVPNSLDLNMDPSAAGQSSTMQMNFNRPMNKVRFNMYDVDRSNGGWQDVLRITGYLNGSTVPIPALVPTSPGNYTISTVGGGNEISTDLNSNCANTNGACNVRIDFATPVDRIDVLFQAGPAVGVPTSQRVAFNDFSYCVPRRDLSMTKVDVTPTFVAGGTGTYALTITNTGGTSTVGTYSVTDILSGSGASFVSPQTPGGGWTCALSTTSSSNDTSTCTRSTAIPPNSATTLTLTVSLSPDTTATSIDNRAKISGGGDESKTTATTTGPIANCSSANEGQGGGGTNSNAGCAFENTLIARQANLSILKSNAVGSVTAGQSTTYTLTAANGGLSAANNAVLTDPAATGLSCTTVSCSVASGTATCPVAPTLSVANLQGAGVPMANLPPNSSLSFLVGCTVTATGTP